MKSLIIMFSTYTRIPMPRVEWDEKSMRRAILALPLAGAVIGLFEILVVYAKDMLSIPNAAAAAIMTAVPVIVTGGIHLDGLIDTADARASFGSREEKLRIIKDPHVGAFGIIRLILYLLLAFSALDIIAGRQLTAKDTFPAAMIPVFSRACTAAVSKLMPKARKKGMLTDMVGEKNEKTDMLVLTCEMVIFAAFLFVKSLYAVIFLALQALLTFFFRHMAVTEFGGVTGDLAGWYLCMTELAGVWAFAASILAGQK